MAGRVLGALVLPSWIAHAPVDDQRPVVGHADRRHAHVEQRHARVVRRRDCCWRSHESYPEDEPACSPH
eukprot:3154698-Heterocapsa_arctica.AAC.1